MKLSRIISGCAVMIFSFAGLAQANSVQDPGIRIGGQHSAIFFTPGHTSVTLTFNTDPLCTASTSTLLGGHLPSMICGIVNKTGAVLPGFTFNFSKPQALSLFQSPGLGTWTANSSGTFAKFIFNTPLSSKNGDIRIEFVNFNPGQTFGVTEVPEPATLTLLASGLGALFMRRRARRNLA